MTDGAEAVYAAGYGPDGRFVEKDGSALDPRYDLADFHPKGRGGFRWGCEGPQVDQLALALLADVLGDELALTQYPYLARNWLARLHPWDAWRVTSSELRAAIASHTPHGQLSAYLRRSAR